MLKSEPKILVRALTQSSTAALEAAVARCVEARNYEVTIEHFLLGLLSDRGSDFSRLLALHGFEPAAVQGALEQECADLRTGNGGRATFSSSLMQLLDDTLHGVILPRKGAKIRSGDLIGELLRAPSRYGVASLVERLQQLPSRGPLRAMPLGDLADEARDSAGAPLEVPVVSPPPPPSTPEPAPARPAEVTPIGRPPAGDEPPVVARRPSADEEPPVVARSPAELKDELVSLLASRSQVGAADVGRVVAAWAQVLGEALAPDGPGAFDWPDVGRFERTSVHVGRTRERRDPFTHETVVVYEGASFVEAGFTPSPALDRLVEPSLLDAAALDGSFEVPWETVEHAYGPAEDIPHHLYLATSPDAETRAAALQALANKLYCQGDVFEATGLSVPFLVRIAAAREIPERADIVEFLAHVAEAQPPDPPPAWWGAHREALEGARARMERLAHDDGDLAEGAKRFLRALGPGERGR